MPEDLPHYFSYLLRIWEKPNNGGTIWRASLERPGEKTRQGFSDLEAVFEFIKEDICHKTSDDDVDS